MRISDWSSDVCSSDLARFGRGRRGFRLRLFQLDPRRNLLAEQILLAGERLLRQRRLGRRSGAIGGKLRRVPAFDYRQRLTGAHWISKPRSEERRVGKEWVRTCRYRWSPYH